MKNLKISIFVFWFLFVSGIFCVFIGVFYFDYGNRKYDVRFLFSKGLRSKNFYGLVGLFFRVVVGFVFFLLGEKMVK